MAVWYDIDRDTRINGNLTVNSASSFLSDLDINGILSLGKILDVEAAIGRKLEHSPASGSALFTGDLTVTGKIQANTIECSGIAPYYTKTELNTLGKSSVLWGNLVERPSTYPPSAHDHNAIYYTKEQSDTLFSEKSNVTHNHDSAYLKLTGGTLTGGLTIDKDNAHVTLKTNDKSWNIELNEGNFSIVEAGLSEGATFSAGGDVAFSGDVYAGKYNGATISGGSFSGGSVTGGIWTSEKSTWLGQDLRKSARPEFNGLFVNTDSNTRPLVIGKSSSSIEALSLGVSDSMVEVSYENDGCESAVMFYMTNTDTANSDGSQANNGTPLYLRQSQLGSFVGINKIPNFALDIDGDVGFSGILQNGTVPWERIVDVPSDLGRWFLTPDGGATKIQVDGGETLSLVAGDNISLSVPTDALGNPIENSLRISSKTYGAQDGIELFNGNIFKNTDKGTSRKIFSNISNGTTTISASTYNDTLTIVGAKATTVSFDPVNKKITISSEDMDTKYSVASDSNLILNNTVFDIKSAPSFEEIILGNSLIKTSINTNGINIDSLVSEVGVNTTNIATNSSSISSLEGALSSHKASSNPHNITLEKARSAGNEMTGGFSIRTNDEEPIVIYHSTSSAEITNRFVIKSRDGIKNVFSVDSDGNIEGKSISVEVLNASTTTESESSFTVKGDLTVSDNAVLGSDATKDSVGIHGTLKVFDNNSNTVLVTNPANGTTTGTFLGTVDGINISQFKTDFDNHVASYSSHSHDERYYTKAEVNNKLKGVQKVIATGTTEVTWTHNYGSTNYALSITPHTLSRHFAIKSKTSTTCVIVMDDVLDTDVLVDLVLIGW